MFNDDREQVPFPEPVGEPHSLAGMLHRMSPHSRVTEPVHKITVEFPADVLDAASLAYDERLFEVCSFTLWF
jgi:hypothetical protein